VVPLGGLVGADEISGDPRPRPGNGRTTWGLACRGPMKGLAGRVAAVPIRPPPGRRV